MNQVVAVLVQMIESHYSIAWKKLVIRFLLKKKNILKYFGIGIEKLISMIVN